MEQAKKIALIAERVAPYVGGDRLTIIMDLTFCIEGGCSLRLDDMLEAPVFDLLHDIYGINENLNHDTHKLENCFWPRYAGK